MAKKKTAVKPTKVKKVNPTHEKYDRDDMVEIQIEDMDPKAMKHLKKIMMGGGYGSINEVIRDVLRRQILGDPPPRVLPKLSTKELINRMGLGPK